MEKKTPKQKIREIKASSRLVAREFSSGGVVYKKDGLKVLWLVSKSKPSKEYPYEIWRLQKGWIDESDIQNIPGPISRGEIRATEEDLQKTAVREVGEEGGVEVKIVKKIGSERFLFKSKTRGSLVLKFVTFYLMEYQKDRKGGFDQETSEILWLPFDKARKKLTHSGEKKILDKAKVILDSGIQSSLI